MCIPSQITCNFYSKVYEAWIFLIRFLVSCIILHLTGWNLIPHFPAQEPKLPGSRYQLATKWEVLFANTFIQIDSEAFSSSVTGICEPSLWPRHHGYFCLFYIQYMGKFPGRVLKLQQNCRFWFLGWLQHVADESQGKPAISVFLPLMLLIFMLKLLLFVPQGEDLSFFSFFRGTNLFSVSKFTCKPKKESEKLKNSHFFGQIHI